MSLHDSELLATKVCSQICQKRKAMFESHVVTSNGPALTGLASRNNTILNEKIGSRLLYLTIHILQRINKNLRRSG